MDSASKEKLKKALLAGNFESLPAIGKSNQIMRQLISFSYDRSGLLSRRAIEAAGFLAARLKHGEAHDVIERLFVMMRDESGGNPWSAPELIGEILRAHLRPLGHLIPILVSFHGEAIFTAGILSALARIATDAPDSVLPYRELAFVCLKSHNPEVRANALMIMKGLRDSTYISEIAKMMRDQEPVLFYDGRSLSASTVGDIARFVYEEIIKDNSQAHGEAL
ncbi:MAG: hypothetical protein M0018_05620 [Nitrospiraceae bacterium]|nr:hypothetical protein [Nitrospiraceae bacterium]